MTWTRVLKGLLVALGLLALVAFVLQNAERTTALSLDLYVGAWKLARPVSVPLLMGICFGAGALLAGAWGWLRGRALSRRLRKIEHELALAGGKSRNDDWMRSPA
jgi:uncharacterized integral membrane protein